MRATRPILFATVAALLVLNLGACSGDEPEAAPTDNMSTLEDERPTVPADAEPTPIVAPTPDEPAAIDSNATADAEPEPVTPPDEQMLDDASATGMTARASRDQPADDAPVTDEIEQK